jgi:hypothetical protein
MPWFSALLVFGVVAWFLTSVNSFSSELGFGYQQLIHARIPWVVLAALWLGGALGVWAAIRSGRWPSWLLVGVESVFVALLSAYFLSISWLPISQIEVELGDTFPAYSLVDQDGVTRTGAAGGPRQPALYVFYRGDW